MSRERSGAAQEGAGLHFNEDEAWRIAKDLSRVGRQIGSTQGVLQSQLSRPGVY